MDSIVNMRLFRQQNVYSNPLDELYGAESSDRKHVKVVTRMVGEGLVVDIGEPVDEQELTMKRSRDDAKEKQYSDMLRVNLSKHEAKQKIAQNRIRRSVDTELIDAVKQSRNRVHLAKAGKRMKCSTLSEDEFLQWAVRILFELVKCLKPTLVVA